MPPAVLDAHASWPHFLDHIAPVWLALPDEVRGVLAVEPPLLAYARSLGLDAERATSAWQHRSEPCLVAGYGDMRPLRRRAIVLMEHGTGQTYTGGRAHPSHAGGDSRQRVALYLNPNASVAAINAAAYPLARQAIIGCPRLDEWHGRPHRRSTPPVLAVAFHWHCTLWPEARGALHHYRSGLAALAAEYQVLGHGHPRLFAERGADLAGIYERAGIEVVREWREVLARADVLLCDNSSVMWEWASIGRPLVVLNAPWYRRHVEHGLRFWQYADVGPQAEQPGDLSDAVAEAIADWPEQAARREEIADALYAYRDGGAAQAAARAIIGWLRGASEVMAA